MDHIVYHLIYIIIILSRFIFSTISNVIPQLSFDYKSGTQESTVQTNHLHLEPQWSPQPLSHDNPYLTKDPLCPNWCHFKSTMSTHHLPPPHTSSLSSDGLMTFRYRVSRCYFTVVHLLVWRWSSYFTIIHYRWCCNTQCIHCVCPGT